jgi:CHASE2 domain-containing sensor protein
MAERLVNMWYLSHSGRTRVFLGIVNPLLLVVAAVGAVMSRGRWRELLPIYAVISYFVLLHSVLFAIFRYMIPIVPALLMLASVPLVRLMTRAAPTFEEDL